MPVLYIACPKTGKPTPTGMAVDPGSHLSGFSQNMVNCQHCKQFHTWDGKDAFFLDSKGNKIKPGPDGVIGTPGKPIQ